ncbi:MAG TPA: glycosyltransferase family 2 protein [Longimicrobiales bacterium]
MTARSAGDGFTAADRGGQVDDTRVEAVIVNWNGRRFLPECLRALRRSTAPVRIIVVDCASTDGSVEYLRSEHPTIEVVASPENVGYAGGANLGLRRGRAPYVLVMNPDVILAPDHLEILCARFDRDPTIGAAQGKLYRIAPESFLSGAPPSGDVIDSAGHRIRRDRMVVDRGAGRPDGPEYSQEASIFSACGAAIFLRRTMLEDAAPDGEYFDSSFFAYKEDIDLCWRARILGWDIRYVPEAVAWHVRGWAGEKVSARARLPLAARRHSWKNHYLLLIKNDRIGDLVRALPFVLAWELARHAYALVREPRVYGAFLDLVRLLPSAIRRRRELFRRRRTHPAEVRRWFGAGPQPARCHDGRPLDSPRVTR